MAEIIADDLMVCRDCLDAIEFDDHDLGYTPGTLFDQQKKMVAHRPDLNLSENRLVNNGEENFVEHSTAPCDTCGTHLHGARYGYAVLD